MHPHRAALQRHPGHLRHDGAKALMQCNALHLPGRQGLAPPGFFCCQIQHRQMARRVLQPLLPEGQRIGASLSGQLVDKAFREKRVVRMPDRAPKAHRNAHFGGHMRHFLVGKAVGQVKQAFGVGFVWRINGAGKSRQHALHPARADGVAGGFDLQA